MELWDKEYGHDDLDSNGNFSQIEQDLDLNEDSISNPNDNEDIMDISTYNSNTDVVATFSLEGYGGISSIGNALASGDLVVELIVNGGPIISSFPPNPNDPKFSFSYDIIPGNPLATGLEVKLDGAAAEIQNYLNVNPGILDVKLN